VLSYWVFKIRRNWVVAGMPGEQATVGVLVPPSELESPPPVPVLLPPPVLELAPVPELELAPVPEVTPPLPERELPPAPLGLWELMVPVQLAAPANRTPARLVRMKYLICALPFCRRHGETIEQSARTRPHHLEGDNPEPHTWVVEVKWASDFETFHFEQRNPQDKQ
jgi:hypothetical protein